MNNNWHFSFDTVVLTWIDFAALAFWGKRWVFALQYSGKAYHHVKLSFSERIIARSPNVLATCKILFLVGVDDEPNDAMRDASHFPFRRFFFGSRSPTFMFGVALDEQIFIWLYHRILLIHELEMRYSLNYTLTLCAQVVVSLASIAQLSLGKNGSWH